MLGSHSSSSSSTSSSPTSSSVVPPLTAFNMAHSSPVQTTSGESAASTPAGNSAGPFYHFQHVERQQQEQQQHQSYQYAPQSQFHAGVSAHPRLHLNTMLAVDDNDVYDHNHESASPQHCNDNQHPNNYSHHGFLHLAPPCNFDAFSQHFHLPLKVAAEKFGVRATAFKKRCRAIGIRHWPYRKVRSLNRSLQELGRCHEQGALNDKQQLQYAHYKHQLDNLLAPETYGVDPSGRLAHHFESNDYSDDDGHESDDACATPSPRYGTTTFSDCSISPTDGDKTFGDFSVSPAAHLRALRAKHQQFQQTQQPYAQVHPYHHTQQQQTQQFQAPSPPHQFAMHFDAQIHPLHRLHVAQAANKEPVPHYPTFPFAASFDPFPHDTKPTGLHVHAQMPSLPPQAAAASSSLSSTIKGENMDTRTSPTAPYNHQQQQHELLTGSNNNDDVRSLNDADEAIATADHASHMDYTNDRFFDDVFLQISPDYGCLV